jgi:putative colanic acid biosynthesis UDP-glucose lipid carrier transferase
VSIREVFASEASGYSLEAPADSRPAFVSAKRALDLVVSLAVFLAAFPVLVLIAVAIKLDSRGPVLFRQCRVGQGGKSFRVLKFRTMHVLEDGAHVAQACNGDPRITPLGKFLRASSLDEAPQLLNVLAGEMSLVGPRPHARVHDEEFARLVPHYVLRRSVKPGLTGWAQVNGLRGPTPSVAHVVSRTDHDVWYARHASLALDLKILARTPRELLFPRNAL